MRRTLAALSLAAGLLAATAGCGSDAGPVVAGEDTPGDGTSADGQPVVTEPGLETATSWRTFDVDGLAVEVLTPLAELPQHATVVRFTGTLIDSGRGGLELCITGVNDSLPPQCRGPVVDGLDPTGWTETQSGVTWGERTVTVAWPPTGNGHLTLVDDEPTLALPSTDDEMVAAMSQLPAECEGIERFADQGAVSAYANAHPDQTGALWVTQQGAVVVLGVVEAHVDEARAALSADGAQPCIVPMRYSTAQLQAVQQRLSERGLAGVDGIVLWSGQIGASNQMSVGVAVADRATVATVASQLDDPGMVRMISTAEILDGA